MESGNDINKNTVKEREETTIYVRPVLNYNQVAEIIGEQINLLEKSTKEQARKRKKK